MLERLVAGNGVVYYASPLVRGMGIPHAFSTRLGGVSGPPFASLNLGNPGGCAVQDESAHIAENYRRLFGAAGCAGRQLRRVHQVHGARVVQVCHQEPAPDDGQADALITDDARCVVSVRVADCVPILLAGDGGRWVAAVHAGWRGVVAGVVTAAVAELAGRCGRELIAAIGPCIGMEAFEVGGEVVAEFRRAFGARAPVRERPDGKGHVDLRAAIQIQLQDAGVSADHIDTTDRCTFRDGDEFFSHRRERGVTGRMAAIISPVASPPQT